VKFSDVLFLAILGLSLGACGVKGKPLPPLTPPVLGRGEPSLSKASEGLKLKKKTQKNNSSSSEPDWDEVEDFPEEKNQ